MSSSCSIRVVCRFRPYNENEKKNKDKAAHNDFDVQVNDGIAVSMKIDKANHNFTFDRVFDWETTQEQFFATAAKPSIDDILEGYNSTIFAYGQTGSGKSFSMFGVRSVDELRGIIPRASAQILTHIDEDQRDIQYALKCSFLEIYKEKIYDLLSPNPKDTSLKVRESPSKGVWVDGLHEEFVGSEDDIADLINVGEAARTVSATDMNARSSRSHSVFMIVVEQKAADGSMKTSKLNLVDLAGSERVAKTNVNAKQLDEAKDINKSLSCLGKCIHALSEQSVKGGKNVHIPYRESSLTRILQESLGGNTKTTLIITCSPAVYNADETLSTLRFGASAKTIKNVVSVNQKRSVEELEALLKNLQKELASLRAYAKKLEQQLGVPSAVLTPIASPAPSTPEKQPLNIVIDKTKKDDLSQSLNLSPRPGSAPSGSRSRAISGPPPTSPRIDSEVTVPFILPSDIEVEDYNPMALAEIKAKYEELQSTSSSIIEQLKVEQSLSEERENNLKFELAQLKEKFDKVSSKLDSTRSKAAQDHTEFSLKIQQLEENLREKTEESDEAIIVLYADNERLENQIQELTMKVRTIQKGQLSPMKEREPPSSSSVANNAPGKPEEEEPQSLDHKIIDLEESVGALKNKLRAAEDKETSLNKKINSQKERIVQITSQVSELTAANSLFKEEIAELQGEKQALETELAAAKAAQKQLEEKYAEQVKQMEKMLQKRARLFKPIKKNVAFQEKVDLGSHISSLKKAPTNFLEMARREHERSQMSRGEELFGIKSNSKAAEKEAYRKIFKAIDKDGSGTIDMSELRNSLKKYGKDISDDELGKLMSHLDKDGNGNIDFEEFYNGMTMISKY